VSLYRRDTGSALDPILSRFGTSGKQEKVALEHLGRSGTARRLLSFAGFVRGDWNVAVHRSSWFL
jgi:hypothetical protein